MCADIKYPARAGHNSIGDAQIAVAESHLAADTRDISHRFEPVAAARRAVEIHGQARCKKRHGWLRKPLSCLAEGDVGEGDNEPAMGHVAPIAMLLPDADPEYHARARTPLQNGGDALQEAARLRVSFKTGWWLFRLCHSSPLHNVRFSAFGKCRCLISVPVIARSYALHKLNLVRSETK